MKTTTILFSFLLIGMTIACKKEIKNTTDTGKFSYTDDNITSAEIAANFMARADGGSFTIGANGLEGGYNGESIDINAKRTSVDINGKKFTPAANTIWLGGYHVPDYLANNEQEINEIYSYFTNVLSEPKTNFTLYDTLNKKLVGFTIRNSIPITLTIVNQNYREAPAGSRIVLHWNADSENNLGVAIALSGDNGLRYIHADETGTLDITDEALEVAGNDRISVTLTRGVIMLGKGADGRDYKLTNRVGKTEIIYI